MIGESGTGVLVVLAVFGAGFCAGASWAAYRAIGWVDRVRAWAATEVDGVRS